MWGVWGVWVVGCAVGWWVGVEDLTHRVNAKLRSLLFWIRAVTNKRWFSASSRLECWEVLGEGKEGRVRRCE